MNLIGGAWRQRWRHFRESRALARRPIPDDLWKRTLIRWPFLRRRDAESRAELRRMTSLFLDRKEFSAGAGMRLTNDVVVAIAAQACLPVLRLGLASYDAFVGIVVHRDQVVVRREVSDDDGVVHVYDEVLAGEAMQGGPLMLSWRDVRAAGSGANHATTSGYNVVIHEFAHVLDMANGRADGMPMLPADIAAEQWRKILGEEFSAFAARINLDEPTALDPYGAQSMEEFFAVASEAFFVCPLQMRDEHPALYAMLARYYRQDPGTEL